MTTPAPGFIALTKPGDRRTVFFRASAIVEIMPKDDRGSYVFQLGDSDGSAVIETPAEIMRAIASAEEALRDPMCAHGLRGVCALCLRGLA